jgi:hypothetical protein
VGYFEISNLLSDGFQAAFPKCLLFHPEVSLNPIMQFKDFEQEEHVVQALAAAKRLLNFYARERARLDLNLSSAGSASVL